MQSVEMCAQDKHYVDIQLIKLNMKTNYSKTTWIDNKTAINASNLNKIENAVSDLFSGALGNDQVLGGTGITVSSDGVGTKTISINSNVQNSTSCTGIEIVTEEPGTPANNKLYLILGTDGKLSRIMLNGNIIFNV